MMSIARDCDRSWDTCSICCCTTSTWYKGFNRVWYTGLLQKLKSYRISDSLFGFILLFLRNIWLCLILHGRYLQEYSVDASFSQVSILGSTVSNHISMIFLMILSAIFLYTVILLLSTLSVIGHLIVGNS